MTAPVRPATGPDVRGRAAWASSFLGFPIGGLAAIAAVGRVDSPTAALVGGAVTGLVIGGAQALATRALRDRGRRLPPVAWIAATTVGTAVGLALGASAVGFSTSLGALALQGALTGVVLGPLQALALPGGVAAVAVGRRGARPPRRWVDRHHAGRRRGGRAVHDLRRR